MWEWIPNVYQNDHYFRGGRTRGGVGTMCTLKPFKIRPILRPNGGIFIDTLCDHADPGNGRNKLTAFQ